MRFSTTFATALSIPLFRSMGFAPAVTFFIPIWIMFWASTVEVLVHSLAFSAVWKALFLTSLQPCFFTDFSISISFATVTPSLVMVGAPKDFWITTLRPFGPNVVLTALASLSTPDFNLFLASREKLISLAIVN